MKNKGRDNKGVSLIVLIVTIVVILILIAAVILSFTGDNNVITQALKARDLSNEATKNEELEMALMKMELDNMKEIVDPVPNTDFVQPWLYNEMTPIQIDESLKKLKCAGVSNIIIQYVGEVEGGESTPVKFKNLWYESSLVSNTAELNLYRPNVIDNIMSAAEANGVKVYLGFVQSNEWWDYKFTNTNWVNNNADFVNQVATELYNKYKDNTSFIGWYWSYEMFTNDQNYDTHWTTMLNNNIAHLNSLESGTKKPLMVSPFISKIYNQVTAVSVKDQWSRIATNVNFRTNDIIAVQDGLVVSGFSVDQLIKFLIAIKEGINEGNSNIKFWINVENFDITQDDKYIASSLDRYKTRLKIASKLAENIVTFSYSHYYLSNHEIDKEYRAYLKNVTGKEYFPIGTPIGGSVYEDPEGNFVPLPKDFVVDEANNTVKNGLVIKDKNNNEFVWVPVNSGVKVKGTGYTGDEYKNISYMRYLENGLTVSNVIEDTIPNSLNEEEQILKYKGFYVGRYESTLDYNSGNKRVAIKKTVDSKANTTFAWQYADSDIYTGYMWNNINYTNAKTYAENMSTSYSYDSNVETGLLNGTQWDTIAKWIHSNDSTYTKINDSRTWGNYTDAMSPANEGNYQSNTLKATGSNEAWKYNNIYDFAGNLAEWTSEKTLGGDYVIRTNGFNGNGQYGSASYAFSSGSYQFTNVGFRVVLYIK